MLWGDSRIVWIQKHSWNYLKIFSDDFPYSEMAPWTTGDKTHILDSVIPWYNAIGVIWKYFILLMEYKEIYSKDFWWFNDDRVSCEIPVLLVPFEKSFKTKNGVNTFGLNL